MEDNLQIVQYLKHTIEVNSCLFVCLCGPQKLQMCIVNSIQMLDSQKLFSSLFFIFYPCVIFDIRSVLSFPEINLVGLRG